MHTLTGLRRYYQYRFLPQQKAEKIMKPLVRLDQSIILVRHDEIVNMMLELTAPPSPVTERAPLDIALVVDRSGSMEGEPLDSVRRAVLELIRVAGPNDRIAVISFDTAIDVVLPLAHHSLPAVRDRILNIHSGGSTNLSGGWLKGFEILNSATPNTGSLPAIKRIIVLTDGHANSGVTDSDELCTMLRGATSHSVSTSMIGFADGYDEKLLAAMADAGRGNDYWCAGPDQALNVFNAEFDGLASVVAQNISLEIQPTEATAAFEVLNEFDGVDVPGAPGARQIMIGDAFSDEVRRVVVRFTLRPRLGVGTFTVANLVLRWASTIGSVELHELTIPIDLESTENASDLREMDIEVTKQVLLLQVADLRKAAIKHAREGHIDKARILLNQVVAILVATGADQREIDEINELTQRLEHFGERDMKMLHSMSRSSNKGRNKRFDPNDPFKS